MSSYFPGRYTGLQFKTAGVPAAHEQGWVKLKTVKIFTKNAVLALSVVLGTLSSPSSGTVSFSPATAPDRAAFSRSLGSRLSDWRLKQREMISDPRLPASFFRLDVYHLPLKAASARVSSEFGPRFHPVLRRDRFHKGLDLPRPRGTPVYPARAGRVVFAGWKRGFGRLVELKHADGRSTLYGHLSRFDVKPGAWVTGSTALGQVGSSGLSTGAHLHFEVRDADGSPLDPSSLLGRR